MEQFNKPDYVIRITKDQSNSFISGSNGKAMV